MGAMKLSVLLFLAVVVIMAALAQSHRPRGRAARDRGASFRRQRPRQGRQDEVDEVPEEGAALPNGCDPSSPIGAFLNFRGVKVWCGGLGVTDFGPYGGLPTEGEEE